MDTEKISKDFNHTLAVARKLLENANPTDTITMTMTKEELIWLSNVIS